MSHTFSYVVIELSNVSYNINYGSCFSLKSPFQENKIHALLQKVLFFMGIKQEVLYLIAVFLFHLCLGVFYESRESSKMHVVSLCFFFLQKGFGIWMHKTFERRLLSFCIKNIIASSIIIVLVFLSYLHN